MEGGGRFQRDGSHDGGVQGAGTTAEGRSAGVPMEREGWRGADASSGTAAMVEVSRVLGQQLKEGRQASPWRGRGGGVRTLPAGRQPWWRCPGCWDNSRRKVGRRPHGEGGVEGGGRFQRDGSHGGGVQGAGVSAKKNHLSLVNPKKCDGWSSSAEHSFGC